MVTLIIVALIIWWLISAGKKKKVNDAEAKLREQQSAEMESLKKALDEREAKITEKENNLTNLNEALENTKTVIAEKDAELEDLQNELAGLYDKSLIETYDSLIISNIDEISSAEIKNKLSLLKLSEAELVEQNGIRLPSYLDSKKERTNLKKKILLPFESEVTGLLNKLTISNVDTTRTKIVKSFERINKLFAGDNAELSKELLQNKLKELELNYSYIVKVNDEKEQQKAIKEQMKDEEKAQRELEQEKKRIDKESRQFNNELSKMMKYLNESNDSVKSEIYSDKIKELEAQIAQLESDKKDVEHREMNTRAGFVYIISNIGSFGEDVYKIGMTKRFDPMDRVKELSSASVPFEFDVHATIFSDDAPTLENKLHTEFAEKAVNKMNSRKEFYHVSLNEIKNVVLNEYDASIEFTELAKAEEYRRSLELAQQAV